MEQYADKGFPDNYSKDVLNVLTAMSLSEGHNVKLVGSSSIRSQIYAGDFDAMDRTNDVNVASRIQDMVKRVRGIDECYISEFKIGEVPEWDVFNKNARIIDGKIHNFNPLNSKKKIDALRANGVITPKEADDAEAVIDKATTILGFIIAKKEIRFHILRWSATDVIGGSIQYRQRRISLDDAIHSGGMIKLDVIYNNRDRFTEFSMLYDIYKGKKLITEAPDPLVQSLQNDIMYYNLTNPFKALKRSFSLAKALKDTSAISKLLPILNSDLGRLYQIIGDINTLLMLLTLKQGSDKEIRTQIDTLRDRMGNIYMLKDFLKDEHTIIGTIEAIVRTPTTAMAGKLEKLISLLQVILDKGTMKQVKGVIKKA